MSVDVGGSGDDGHLPGWLPQSFGEVWAFVCDWVEEFKDTRANGGRSIGGTSAATHADHTGKRRNGFSLHRKKEKNNKKSWTTTVSNSNR